MLKMFVIKLSENQSLVAFKRKVWQVADLSGKVWVARKAKAATSSPKNLSRETVRFVAYLWPTATYGLWPLMHHVHWVQLRYLCAALIVISVTAPALLYLPPSMAVAWRIWLSSLRASNFFSTAKRSHQERPTSNQFFDPYFYSPSMP